MPKTTKELNENKTRKDKEALLKKATSKTSTTSPKKDVSKTKSTNKKNTTSKNKSSISTTKKEKKTSLVSNTKKTTTKKTTSKKKEPIYVLEYYDLPYRYNQTVVKVLAQTPTSLFVYWDISDEDRLKYQLKYGENFFDLTKPVLVVHNQTMNYSYEIDINDFANSWYLHINDPDCKYYMELGRRPQKVETLPSYIPIITSNKIDAPNNHVLFNSINQTGNIVYTNVKSKSVFNKTASTIIPSMSKIYKSNDIVYNLYKNLYPNDWKIIEKSNINNPSSGGISSFK